MVHVGERTCDIICDTCDTYMTIQKNIPLFSISACRSLTPHTFCITKSRSTNTVWYYAKALGLLLCILRTNITKCMSVPALSQKLSERFRRSVWKVKNIYIYIRIYISGYIWDFQSYLLIVTNCCFFQQQTAACCLICYSRLYRRERSGNHWACIHQVVTFYVKNNHGTKKGERDRLHNHAMFGRAPCARIPDAQIHVLISILPSLKLHVIILEHDVVSSWRSGAEPSQHIHACGDCFFCAPLSNNLDGTPGTAERSQIHPGVTACYQWPPLLL